MQNPLTERRPEATYRLIKMPLFDEPSKTLYAVQIFDVGRPVEDSRMCLYRFDLLPQWLQAAVAALDVAGSGHVVAGVGKKVGQAYWFPPEGVDAGFL